MINEGGRVSFRWVEGLGKSQGLSRPGSQTLMITQTPGNCSKTQIWNQQFWVGPGSLISDKLPSSDHTLNSKGEGHTRNLDFILSETGKKLLKGFKQVT